MAEVGSSIYAMTSRAVTHARGSGSPPHRAQPGPVDKVSDRITARTRVAAAAHRPHHPDDTDATAEPAGDGTVDAPLATVIPFGVFGRSTRRPHDSAAMSMAPGPLPAHRRPVIPASAFAYGATEQREQRRALVATMETMLRLHKHRPGSRYHPPEGGDAIALDEVRLRAASPASP